MDSNHSQVRLDKWLKNRYPGLTRRHVEEVFARGLVTSKLAKKLNKGFKTSPTMDVDTTRLDGHLKRLREGTPIEIKVGEENADWVVVDKPAGIPCHPLSLFDNRTLTHWALFKYPEMRESFGTVQPEVTPHRLDTGTAGLTIVAKNPTAFNWWREQFSRKKVTKSYRALAWGSPEWDEKEMDYPIGHHRKDPRKMTVEWEVREGTMPIPAQTKVKVLERFPNGTFSAEIECRTGVTHQIRVHLATEDFPLVGDELYDPEYTTRALKPASHMLRAYRLQVEDKTIELSPELPELL